MNGRPSLTELEAFSAVSRLRSFRKAADELGQSPSTLSHLMRNLEARLGARLLNRTTRSVSPTAAGERLLERLSPILADLDGALAELDEARERPAGTLRITASESAGMLLVRTAVPAFLAAYPLMRLDLVAEPAFVDIVAEGFDAGVRLGEAVPRDMVAVRFGGPSRMLAVAAPGYMAGRDLPATPHDLRGHACIRSRSPAGRPYRWEFERHGEALAIEVDGPLMLNRTELMVEAALEGLGVAFVPERLARPHLAAGRLVALLEDWCPAYPGLFLYYPGHRLAPPGLRAFIEVLRRLPADL